MKLPPGPSYLLQLSPRVLLASASVYLVCRILVCQYALPLPTWLMLILSALAKPCLFLATKYFKRIRDVRTARSLGAVLPPFVQESPLSIISKIVESTRNGYPAEVMQRWFEQYGSVVRFDVMTYTGILVNDPDHVKAILATQFDSFEKGFTFHQQMDSLLGTGIFNADGDLWKFHRSITRPFFTRERVSDFEIYKRNSDISLKAARDRLNEGYSVDFQDLVSRFTLDSAAEFLFGTNIDSLSAGIPYPPQFAQKNAANFYTHSSNIFAQAFTEGQIVTSLRYSMGGEWPLGPEFWGNAVEPLRKIMDEFTEPLIADALAKRLAMKSTFAPQQESNLLAHLVNQTQDPMILKDELVNLLVAGRDTTMCLLSYALYMLAEHPEIETRLREEILEKVGPTECPTYSRVHDLRFMRAFINEVLRLYPPVPLNYRTSKEGVVLHSKFGEQPFYIPADTSCFYSVLNMQRRTDLWGPDALEFDPDRFLDDRHRKYLLANPYIFCPFNAGPRVCLGQQFAYHEASFYLVRLLQTFTDFELDETVNARPPEVWKECNDRRAVEKIHPQAHLTMCIKGGLWVKMKELNN